MPITAQELEIALEERERWRRTLNVTVPASVVREERRRIVRKLSGNLKLPGFRSGRIPESVVEQRYGQAVNREMLDRLIGDAYRQALEARSLEPISQGEVDDVKYEPDQDLVFSISFDVQPEFEVARLGGFVVERPEVEVTDADVGRVLDRLRDQNAAWRPVEEGAAEDGDLVSVSVTKLEGGEPEGEPQDYDLVLGEGDAIPEVEDAIRTLEVGGSDDFHVKFPDDFPDEERRGEAQHLRVAVRARRVKDLPELDDAFARSLGDFDDLGTLEARVRDDLAEEAADQVKGAVRGQIVQNLIDANPFDVPDSMIDRYVDSVLGDVEGVDPERVAQAREQIRPEATRAVKRILILDRIAEVRELRATEEELDARIEKIAEANDASPAEVYARLQKSGRLESLERELTEDKVFDFLEGESKIVPA